MRRSGRAAFGRITMGLLVAAGLGVAAFGVAATVPGRAAEARTGPSTAKSARAVAAGPSGASGIASGASGQTPPYPVGAVHLTLTRTESDGSQRQFAVTVRYPAAASVAGEVNDAPAAPGTFPLVVFAHGYDTSADTYAAIERDLASAGFVVAAPDFPHTSSASRDGLDESDVASQPGDLSYTIDTLTTAAPAAIAGHVSSAKVGVVGHSDGGVTAAGLAYNSCCADHRLGAAVILSGAKSDFGGSWFPGGSPPLLAIHGTADEVNPFSSSQQLFDDASGSKDLVSVANGSHLGPFTTDPVRPAISTLIADFLRAHLVHDAAAAQRVVPDANVSGLQLVASS